VKFAALAGYKMTYTSALGFGIIPMVDLIWKINVQPAEKERDLFRR